ncbi:hypothetical protein PT974_01905 [Cladobotryum mycophilum]|uniref:HNH nuclease domain-containing protein n=1 Tax=Cladobotryum mycophilum TaxID=491253 RepID=A0ABR0SWM1_9HYPO
MDAEGLQKIADEYSMDPELIIKLCQLYQTDKNFRIFFDDEPATEPVLSFIPSVEVRLDLFKQLQTMCHQATSLQLSATVFAVAMIKPLSRLKEMVKRLQYKPREYHPVTGSEDAAAIVTDMWDLIPQLTEHAIRVYVTKRCRDWKLAFRVHPSSECIVSGWSDPAPARIFPILTSKEDLEHFQGSKNALLLNRQLVYWWNHGRFALKPLRQTDNEIVLQWHWLKRPNLEPSQYIQNDDNLWDIVGTLGWDEQHPTTHRKSGRRVETGQIYTLRTNDPKDLPSFELLEMQWNFHRMTAVCGMVLDE